MPIGAVRSGQSVFGIDAAGAWGGATATHQRFWGLTAFDPSHPTPHTIGVRDASCNEEVSARDQSSVAPATEP
jgi:hypothetical protein